MSRVLTAEQLKQLAIRGRNGSKMSAVLEAGIALVPLQTFRSFYETTEQGGFAACALGTMAAAIFRTRYPDRPIDALSHLSNDAINRLLYQEFGSIQVGGLIDCGMMEDGKSCRHSELGLRRIIGHWNDDHRMSRERIVRNLKGKGW